MVADLVRAELGDEAQVERSRRVDGPGFPVRCSGGTHVDLLASENQRDPVVAEDFPAHAEHPHIPVHSQVYVAAVEHHVVDAIDTEGHASRYLPELTGLIIAGGPLDDDVQSVERVDDGDLRHEG